VAESTQTLAEDSGAQPGENAGEHVSEYTTETSAEAEARSARRPVVTGSALGTGRRKEAIARVRITPGTGQWRINERSLEDFFPNKVHQQLISEPFVTLGAEGQFDVAARITLVDPGNRVTLKRAGFLTRDARVKERKKYGLKKARKAPQYSKR
jgi:small subunit ribosomal protein S9